MRGRPEICQERYPLLSSKQLPVVSKEVKGLKVGKLCEGRVCVSSFKAINLYFAVTLE